MMCIKNPFTRLLPEASFSGTLTCTIVKGFIKAEVATNSRMYAVVEELHGS